MMLNIKITNYKYFLKYKLYNLSKIKIKTIKI